LDPNLRSLSLRHAFPELALAIRPHDRDLAVVVALRTPRWDALAHTLALAACRRRDRALGELVAFPAAWLDRGLDGEWGAPSRPPGDRARRVFRRAGLLRWREVMVQAPPQLLARSGAGLVLLAEVAACAVELSAVFQTSPNLRIAAGAFGPRAAQVLHAVG